MTDFFAWAEKGGPPEKTAGDRSGPSRSRWRPSFRRRRRARCTERGWSWSGRQLGARSELARAGAARRRNLHRERALLPCRRATDRRRARQAGGAGARISEASLGEVLRYSIFYMPGAVLLLGSGRLPSPPGQRRRRRRGEDVGLALSVRRHAVSIAMACVTAAFACVSLFRRQRSGHDERGRCAQTQPIQSLPARRNQRIVIQSRAGDTAAPKTEEKFASRGALTMPVSRCFTWTAELADQPAVDKLLGVLEFATPERPCRQRSRPATRWASMRLVCASRWRWGRSSTDSMSAGRLRFHRARRTPRSKARASRSYLAISSPSSHGRAMRTARAR